MEQHRVERFAPLPGRVGHVGGIESLTLDGRRHYFGFDYGSDIIVSPLIDDPDAMAAFASAYMRQTTGTHDAAYWAGLVAAAAGNSALAEDTEREFTTEGLRGDLPVPGSHLLYLLGAATEWEDWFEESPEAERAFERLGLDEEDAEFLDQCLHAVREHGTRARPDEWTVIRLHLGAAVRHLPGNWDTLFAPLAEGIAHHG
ncbi:hypothetical protein ACFYYY_16315 [Streptomyces sp. NPDC001834]|uniref:hypothetical protein n=1 Tax=Streptomyces sp. NPDC001834 TaxID=3364616 RepID=UPI0036AC144F